MLLVYYPTQKLRKQEEWKEVKVSVYSWGLSSDKLVYLHPSSSLITGGVVHPSDCHSDVCCFLTYNHTSRKGLSYFSDYTLFYRVVFLPQQALFRHGFCTFPSKYNDGGQPAVKSVFAGKHKSSSLCVKNNCWFQFLLLEFKPREF